MKKLQLFASRPQQPSSRQALRGGGYSLAITAIVLAIVVALNVFAAAAPASWTQLDMSSAQLYSVTSNTKAVVGALQEDVTIYWIVQADAEDDVLENLLNKYESFSDRISVVKKNPDVFPTFAQQYTDETVYNNSLIVVSGERSRFISVEDIYLYEDDTSYYATDFDGEGAITSAIDYVTREELPQLYLVEGHGEAALPENFATQIERDNIETVSFSLLTQETVPEEADCVLIYAPESDLSEDETAKLADYIAGGGKLMVVSGPLQEGTLANLNSLPASYGVTVNEGIVVEADTGHYVSGYPYFLLPEMTSHAITDALISDNYYPLIPIAAGLTVSDSSSATALLTTSDNSFNKSAGWAVTTYEKEEEDTDGPFALAVSIEDTGGGALVWFSSSFFLESTYNSYSSGANGDLAMNALASLIGETEAMAIRSKSLTYNYLTINESAAAMLKALMIGALPLAYFGAGVVIALRRRRLQNETV